MKVHFPISSLLAIFISTGAFFGQSLLGENNQAAPATDVQQNQLYALSQEQRLKKIAQYEDAVHRAESSHIKGAFAGKTYAALAVLYEDAAMYPQSEIAYHRAISILSHTSEPDSVLATIFSNLSGLHMEMGKLHDAKKEELKALRIREANGDRFAIARSWSNLAVLYLGLGQFEQSRDFAQKAASEFFSDKQADVTYRLAALFTLSQATCGIKDCQSAIPALQDAIALAKRTFQPNDIALGVGYFLLGYADWRSGNLPDASDNMKQGISIMDHQFGWGHPAYLAAMKKYDEFLRENHHEEEAKTVESRIQQINSVVDVRTLAANHGTNSFMGMR